MSDIDRCSNARCGRALAVDHVTLVTTRHVRRFCSVECIAEGQAAVYDAVAQGEHMGEGRVFNVTHEPAAGATDDEPV